MKDAIGCALYAAGFVDELKRYNTMLAEEGMFDDDYCMQRAHEHATAFARSWAKVVGVCQGEAIMAPLKEASE